MGHFHEQYYKKMDSVEATPIHPTAQRLVDTVKEMLKDTAYNNIKSENVLLRSGISRGPLYHHFANFEELIQIAQTQVYQDYVGLLSGALINASTALEDPMATREEFANIIRSSQVANSVSLRRQRVGIVHNATSTKGFSEKLGATQEGLTLQWIKIYQICVDKGWADPSLDPRTVAILLQSTFFGRVLDDISPVHMNGDAWVVTMIRLLDNFCFSTSLASRVQD